MDLKVYQIADGDLKKSACQMIAKLYNKKDTVIVLAPDEEEQKLIDIKLWTFSQKEFVPHATCTEENLLEQPVIICTSFEEMDEALEKAIESDESGIGFIANKFLILSDVNAIEGDIEYIGNFVSECVEKYKKSGKKVDKNASDATVVYMFKDDKNNADEHLNTVADFIENAENSSDIAFKYYVFADQSWKAIN